MTQEASRCNKIFKCRVASCHDNFDEWCLEEFYNYFRNWKFIWNVDEESVFSIDSVRYSIDGSL